MNASDRRALKLITQSKGDVRASLKSFLSKQITRSVKKPIQKAREAKEKQERLSVKKKTSDIWKGGEARASGICECGCGVPFDLTFYGRETLDHFDNGTGKTKRQKLATCWKLRWGCHIYRQALWPNTAVWNAKFRAHCDVNGISPVFQHIEHAPVARKSSRALGLGQRVPPSPASSPDARDLPKVHQ